MANLDAVRSRVQRMLTDTFGRVEVDRDGDFIIRHESAVTFVSVGDGFGDSAIVSLQCPLICDVKITDQLCRWVATEGQKFILGGCFLNPNEDPKTGWVYFKYAMTADDLDESELKNAVGAVAVTSNRLDNELRDRFGGELFGRE